MTMNNTLALHREMVIAQKKAWDQTWELMELGIEVPELQQKTNHLFKISERLRDALIADGIEVAHYNDIYDQEDNEG